MRIHAQPVVRRCGESPSATRRSKKRLLEAAGYRTKPQHVEHHTPTERPRERRAVRRTRARGPDDADPSEPSHRWPQAGRDDVADSGLSPFGDYWDRLTGFQRTQQTALAELGHGSNEYYALAAWAEAVADRRWGRGR